jgi:hypothetical protein
MNDEYTNIIKGNGKDKKTFIKIASGGKANMNYVNMENIEFENNGISDMGNINMKNAGYINEKSGVTNIEGKLKTDSPINNKGVFNIKPLGSVLIQLKGLKKEHPIIFWAAVATILGFLFQVIWTFKP